MDQNNNETRRQPPPGADPPAAEFTSSAWPESVYFFADVDRDYSTILSEFGCSLQELVPPRSSSIGEEYPGGTSSVMPPSTTTTTGEVEATGAGRTSNNCPALSSDSSEDPAADKSTGSDGNTPAETSSSNNKVKKKGQKRMRQPRFAFMTKSDVDHLEDGYRWRKYGQKAVKNSPFPRSYYRCTNSKCTVKKRVERSSEDPTVVITTYEGQHCHHSVGFPRGAGGVLTPHETAAAFGPQMAPPLLPQLYHPQRLVRPNSSLGEINSPSLQPDLPPIRPVLTNSEADSQQLPAAVSSGEFQMQQHLERTKPPDDHPSDEGLLGDIVPSMMRHR